MIVEHQLELLNPSNIKKQCSKQFSALMCVLSYVCVRDIYSKSYLECRRTPLYF